MTKLRKRLTYANVMSSIAVFVVLGGATAVAAKKIGSNELKSNSVTTAKLKKNAVTAAKIKKDAVTKAKIKDGAVDGSKIADGAVIGADINAPSTPFSQIVAKVRGGSAPSVEGPRYLLAIRTYTQDAGDDRHVHRGGRRHLRLELRRPPQAVAPSRSIARPGVPSNTEDSSAAASSQTLPADSAAPELELRSAPGSYLDRCDVRSPARRPSTPSCSASSCNAPRAARSTVTGAGVDVIGTK